MIFIIMIITLIIIVISKQAEKHPPFEIPARGSGLQAETMEVPLVTGDRGLAGARGTQTGITLPEQNGD
jgi:hypothetical protein